ncbi:MAG: flagellar assembly protein FliH [Azoarcus sp.]|jgi:flagellar assembly protein FliH|nr:flagellar assembly protein FliH [Azoarcus sp.]
MKNSESFAHHQAVGAYRRWEPPRFDAPQPPDSAPPSRDAAATPETETSEAATAPPALPPGIRLPTAAEIEQMHEDARREGYEEGLREGRDQGQADGREAGFVQGREAGYDEGKAAAEVEAKQLHELVAQLDQALGRLDAEVAEELMSLAIELARKVLQHTLAVEPEAVISTVRAALRQLPESRARIHMNPADVALAHKHLDEALKQSEHLIVEDDSVSRGGCRVETAGAQIDASMETRWRRVLDSLGRQHAPWTSLTKKTNPTEKATEEPADDADAPNTGAPKAPGATDEPETGA